jgi:DUF971 family protein
MTTFHTAPPTGLKAHRDQGVLEIAWPDGRTDRLSFFDVRCACPCASCIDEITGRPLLRRELVPADVVPRDMHLVGNYALGIHWSDGHTTGIYTWDRLRGLGTGHE